MTAEKILHVLQQARAAGIKYKSLKSKACEYSQRLKDGKRVYYHGDGIIYERQGNSTERSLCAMLDYEAETDEAAKAMTPLYLKAGKLIYRIKDERRRAILNKYYLYCHGWKEIAEELCVSVRWVKKLHKRAIEEIAESCETGGSPTIGGRKF